jgi:hypothetical protein
LNDDEFIGKDILMTDVPTIDLESLLAIGIVFRNTADPEAGWKLLEGLESPDPALRILAQTLLVEGGSASMSILEGALSTGAVSTDTAAPCIAAILRAQIQPKWIASQHVLN